MLTKELGKVRELLFQANFEEADKRLNELKNRPSLEKDDAIMIELLRIMSFNAMAGRMKFDKVINMVDALLSDNRITEYPAFQIDALLEKEEALNFSGRYNEMFDVIRKIERKIELLDNTSNEYFRRKGMMKWWEGYAKWVKSGQIGVRPIFEENEKLVRKADYKLGIAMYNLVLGKLDIIQGNPEKGIDGLNKSVSMFRSLNHTVGTNWAKINIGFAHRVRGEFEKAIEIHEQALKSLENIDHKLMMSFNLIHLGYDYRAMGQPNMAISHFERSLDLCREIGNNSWIAGTLGNLSDIYTQIGKYTRALDYVMQSLDIFKQLKSKNDIGWSQYRIGEIHNKIGNLNKAIISLNNSISTFEDVDQEVGLAFARTQLAYSHLLMGNLDNALERVKNALQVFESNNLQWGLSFANDIAGRIYFEQGDFDKAEKSFANSIKIRETNSTWVEALAMVYYQMVKLNTNRHKLEVADKFVSKLRNLNKNSNNRLIRQTFKLSQALVLKNSSSKEDHTRAINLLRDIKDEGPINYELKINIETVLPRILINELAVKREEPVVSEVRTYLTSLQELADKQKSPLLSAETYSLQGEFAKVEKEPTKSKTYFDKAKDLVRENKFERLSRGFELE